MQRKVQDIPNPSQVQGEWVSMLDLSLMLVPQLRGFFFLSIPFDFDCPLDGCQLEVALQGLFSEFVPETRTSLHGVPVLKLSLLICACVPAPHGLISNFIAATHARNTRDSRAWICECVGGY